MKASNTIVGLVGGIAVTLLLLPGAYLDVPRSYIVDWTTAPRSAGLVTTLLAAVAIVLVGMAAARQQPDEPARAGILAGFIASAVGLVTVALPASSLMAMGSLIAELEGGRVRTIDLKRALATGVILVPFYQALAGAIVLGSGVLLGWLGAVVQDLWKGTPVRHTVTVRPSPVPWVGLAVGLLATPSLLAGIGTMESIVFEQLGGTSTWLGQAQLTSPLLLSAAIIGGCLFYVARDAALVRREGQTMRAIVWIIAALGMVGVQGMVAVPIFWQILILPGGWGALALLALCPLAGLVVGTTTKAELETAPRLFGEVVAEAVVAATIAVLLIAVNGSSAGTAIALVAGPWIEPLATAERTIDTISAADAVHATFMAHAAFPALLLAFLVAWMVVAVPLWGMASRLRR